MSKTKGPLSKVNESNNYTHPELRKRLYNKIKAGSKGGKPGQWTARKAQLLAVEYKKAGGGYKSGKKKPQKSLKKWTKQKWTTKSGKPSTQGPLAKGERYMPAKAVKSLTSAEHAATTKKKREGTAKGKQFVANTKAAKKKIKRAKT